LAGLSGCEYFGEVLVPSSDSAAPYSILSVWHEGEHRDLSLGRESLLDASSGNALEYAISDRDAIYIAISAGLDGGGVREIRQQYRVSYRCLWGPPVRTVLVPWTPMTQTQRGEVGDSVSNGLWTGAVFRARNYLDRVEGCPSDGFRLEFEWLTSSEDFHGNRSAWGLGVMRYVDWGT